MSTGRFLTREEVADELAITMSQAYALIRRKELRALKVGGRGTWRIGRDDLEAYIARAYDDTARWIEEHPFTEDDAGQEDGDH
jgi:excisionase family DNA binding protein